MRKSLCFDTLLARATRLLSRREYGRQELRDRLIVRGEFIEDESILDRVLDACERLSYLSDARCIEAYVRRHEETRGPQRIRQELQQKGFSSEAIRVGLQSYESSTKEYDRARQVWMKRFRGARPQDRTTYRRQACFLGRRGFSFEVITRVLTSHTVVEDDVS